MPSKVGTPPKRRVLAFVRALNKRGGQYELLDNGREWLDRYCGDHEPTDTYNRAEELGWTKTTHDTSYDESIVRITDAGRAALGGANV